MNDEQCWVKGGKYVWCLCVVSWSSFKSGRWCVATVACVKRVVAVVETGEGSDKGVNGDDGSETGGDVGVTGGWPSTTVNSYRDLVWIYVLYA